MSEDVLPERAAASEIGLRVVAIDAVLLVGFAIIVYGMLLQPGAAPYSKHSDLIQYAWPMKQVLYDALQAGEGLPFWRIDQLSGNPATAAPQSLHLYPLHFLYWIVEPLSAVGPTLFLELLFSAAGAYFLGASLGLSRGPRLLMAAAQLCSFKLMIAVYAGWIPVIPAYTVLPWFGAALLRGVERPSAGSIAGLALVAALAFQIGRVQEYYYAVLLLAPAVLVRAGSLARTRGPREGLALLGALGIAGVLGLGMSAHLWLPLLSDLSLLSRGELDYPFFLSGHGLDRTHLWTLLSPEALGTPRLDTYLKVELWEDVLYFGWIPCLLALVGTVRGQPVRRAHTLAAAAAVSLLLCFDTPLLRMLFDYLPGFALFRVPSRMAFVTSVMVIALAGLGAEALRPWLARIDRRAASIALCVALAVVLGEGAVRARQYVVMKPHVEFEPDLPVATALERSAHRSAVVGPLTLTYGWASRLGLQLVNGYDPYGYAHYWRYLGVMVSGSPPVEAPGSRIELPGVTRLDMLEALGVRYLLSANPITPPDDWTQRGHWPEHPAFLFYRGFQNRDLYLYEKSSPRDRASFVDSVVTAIDADDAERRVLSTDLREVAIVESAAAIANDASEGDSIGEIDAAPGRTDFVARVGAPRFVRIAEVWHPGWQATVNGRPLELVRSDMTLMGVELPAGESRVELRFRPPGWGAGVAVASIASVVWLGLVGWSRRTRT